MSDKKNDEAVNVILMAMKQELNNAPTENNRMKIIVKVRDELTKQIKMWAVDG